MQGYELGCQHAEVLLDMVAQLAMVPVKDPCHSEALSQPPASSQADSHPQEEAPRVQGLPAADILVRAISFRAGYGGMGGDMAMLRAYAQTWQQRCVNGECCACACERYACKSGQQACWSTMSLPDHKNGRDQHQLRGSPWSPTLAGSSSLCMIHQTDGSASQRGVPVHVASPWSPTSRSRMAYPGHLLLCTQPALMAPIRRQVLWSCRACASTAWTA